MCANDGALGEGLGARSRIGGENCAQTIANGKTPSGCRELTKMRTMYVHHASSSTNNIEVEVDAVLNRDFADEHGEEPSVLARHDEVAQTLETFLCNSFAGIVGGGVGLRGSDGEFAVHLLT
jgi:hypothetical protein